MECPHFDTEIRSVLHANDISIPTCKRLPIKELVEDAPGKFRSLAENEHLGLKLGIVENLASRLKQKNCF